MYKRPPDALSVASCHCKLPNPAFSTTALFSVQRELSKGTILSHFRNPRIIIWQGGAVRVCPRWGLRTELRMRDGEETVDLTVRCGSLYCKDPRSVRSCALCAHTQHLSSLWLGIQWEGSVFGRERRSEAFPRYRQQRVRSFRFITVRQGKGFGISANKTG